MAGTSVWRAERNNWPWIIGTGLGGLILVALAVAADVRWGWRDIWPSVFLESGMTLLLAALLFLVERRFTRKVTEAVTHQITASGASRSSGSARAEVNRQATAHGESHSGGSAKTL